jgi:hypothetical protein
MKMKRFEVHHLICALVVLVGCGESSLGSGPAAGTGGNANLGGAAGVGEAGGATTVMGGNSGASSASGGSSADAAAGHLDSGSPTSQDAEAGPKIDPRFRIIEPLAPPAEWVTGRVGNRVHHTLLPTDVAVGLTSSVLWASDDLSVIVGTSVRNIRHPPGDSVGSYGRTYVWTEALGTRGIDAVPTSAGDTPVGTSSDASVIYGISEGDDGQPSLFRWTASGTTLLEVLAGLSVPNLSLEPGSPTVWGHVAQNGSALLSSDDGGVIRWTQATGWSRLSSPSGFTAMSQTGNEVLFVSEGSPQGFHWWSPATGVLDIDPLPGFTLNNCEARLLTSDGSTVVGLCRQSTPPYASSMLRWTRTSGTTSLAPAPANSAFDDLSFMSPDGAVITGIMSTNDAFGGRTQIFRYTQASGFQIIFDGKVPNQNLPAIYGMTPDGRVIFGMFFPPDIFGDGQPYVWREGSGLVQNLVHAPTLASRDGSVLAGTQVVDQKSEVGYRPFIIDGKGERDIAQELTAAGVDLGGFHLSSVVLIESGTDIRIVGKGIYPGTSFPPGNLPGEERAWVARLPIRP